MLSFFLVKIDFVLFRSNLVSLLWWDVLTHSQQERQLWQRPVGVNQKWKSPCRYFSDFAWSSTFYPHIHPIQGLLLRTTSQIHNSRPNSDVHRLRNKQLIILSRNIRHEQEDNNHLLQAQQQRPSPLARRSSWQQRRIFFLPFSSIFSRLWSSTLQEVNTDDDDDDNDMGDPFSNQTRDELPLAKALRDQATSIRSEAKAMELALQQTLGQRQVTKMAEVDSIISTLFSSLSKDSIATTKESTTTAADTTIESSRKSIETTN